MKRVIELYQPHLHKEQLQQWYKDWNLPDNSHLMSNLGLIVQDIGAIFLFTTNSKLCLLDGFISNPHSDKQERDEYLDKMVAVMLHQAKELGFKYIMGTSQFPQVIERAEKHGFKVMDKTYTGFMRSL